MDSANNTNEVMNFLTSEDNVWVNRLRLPVLRELVVKILSARGHECDLTSYPSKELTLDELAWTKFESYRPAHVFYAQNVKVFKDAEPFYGTFHVFYDGSIILFSRMWKYSYAQGNRYSAPKGQSPSHNDMTIRVIQIKACDHDYETTHSRMCYREYRCRKCGHEYSVDSSD